MSGILDAITDGGPVIMATAALLLLMSVASIAIIVSETLRLWLSVRAVPRFSAPAPARADWYDLTAAPSATRAHVERQINATGNNSMTILASIGSNAPYIGLFGTVVSIHAALTHLGSGITITMQQISGPVGEALVMTAFGLSVAVPAVLGYNFLLELRARHAEILRAYCAQVEGIACPADLRLLDNPSLFNRKA